MIRPLMIFTSSGESDAEGIDVVLHPEMSVESKSIEYMTRDDTARLFDDNSRFFKVDLSLSRRKSVDAE